jgi:hypothetical protein
LSVHAPRRCASGYRGPRTGYGAGEEVVKRRNPISTTESCPLCSFRSPSLLRFRSFPNDCLDHVIVFDESLRRILGRYLDYLRMVHRSSGSSFVSVMKSGERWDRDDSSAWLHWPGCRSVLVERKVSSRIVTTPGLTQRLSDSRRTPFFKTITEKRRRVAWPASNRPTGWLLFLCSMEFLVGTPSTTETKSTHPIPPLRINPFKDGLLAHPIKWLRSHHSRRDGGRFTRSHVDQTESARRYWD